MSRSPARPAVGSGAASVTAATLRRAGGLPLLLTGAMVLLTVLVLSFAAFATRRLRVEALAAAETEGRALLCAVAAGVERSLHASVTVEELVAERLLDAGRHMGRELAERRGFEHRLLTRLARDHGLRGALFADTSFRILAVAGGNGSPDRTGANSPFASDRIFPLVAERMLDRARQSGLGEAQQVIVGFGASPFSRRVEFLVGLEAPGAEGWLVLWEDAQHLQELQAREGVKRLLDEAVQSPAIVWLSLESEVGEVVADTPRESREVLEVTLPTSFRGKVEGALRVGLTREPIDGVVRRGREGIRLFAGSALVLGLVSALALGLLDRGRRRREARLARESAERERAADLGRMAAGVAHEIKSPLNAISMATQFLSMDAVAAEPDLARIREMSATAKTECARLSDTVGEFLSLGHTRDLRLEEVAVADIVAEVVASEHPGAIVESPREEIVLRADREQLRRALGNLVRNARQAAGDAPVRVSWKRTGAEVELAVSDGGPGIPPADRERVFLHFVTGRPGGSGVGLAVVRGVAERHGGRVELADGPDGGACFRVILPVGGRDD